MKTEESSSSLVSTKLPIIRSAKKEEKELEGDDGNRDDDDEENHLWIEFFENITNNNNLDDKDEGNDDDNDDDDRNEGTTAGRWSSSIMIKTKEDEVPDSIPSKSSMIEMEEEEEVDEDVLTSIINSTLVWGDGIITGGVTTCEGQQQVKKEEKKKEEEEAVAKKEDDNGNDTGYESLVKGISPNTHDAFLTSASTNYCVRRKFNGVDDERKPPPKKKIRVLAAVEEDINCEADEDHTDDDDDGDGDGTSSKTIPTEMKYNNRQIEFWNKMFRQLVDYKEKHQTTHVSKYSKEDPQLELWITNQRACYRKNKISKYRMDLLDGVGFVWGNIYGAQWMEMYQRLMAYKKQHKTTSVPQRYKEDEKLGVWVKYQQERYKNNLLSVRRINYLESIGFVWKTFDRVPWIEMYERIVAYKQRYGSTLVPCKYTEDPSLGIWVKTQRGSYNKGKLLEKRMELLNSIDFVWSVKAGR